MPAQGSNLCDILICCMQVNNAGILDTGTIENTSLKTFDQAMRTNVR